MAELTKPKCAQYRVPHSCCAPEHCHLTLTIARVHGVELPTTNHPKLPLMGPDGCTAPPHLRPHCTLHVCSINSLGFDPKDEEFTKKYFKLREEIDTLEYEEWELQQEQS